MYEEYYGFSKKPFSIVPDPHFFFLSAGHAEALAHLMYGINNEGGFVLLTGDVGTGKTTACRRLLEMLPEGTEVAFILNPELSVVELLISICREFGITPPAGQATNQTLVTSIHDYLLAVNARGRRAILILEEAQNLKPELLEQIRLLTNLETNAHKLLQVILIGQPELRDLLNHPRMLQLSQRITARYHLGPLSREETGRYVQYRLDLAGSSRGYLFPPVTVKKLYRLSRGVPRLINVICDRALLGAFVQEKDRVDPKTLKQAAREATGQGAPPRKRSAIYSIGGAVLVLVLAALGTGVFLSGYRPWTAPPPETKAVVQTPKAEPPPVVRNDLGWPGDLSGEQTRRLAQGALAKLWRLDVKPGNLCELAVPRGLRCLEGRASLTHLRQMNKPAVLTLVDEKKGTFYTALTKLRGNTATVILGSETRAVAFEEINRIWAGEYLLLWRVPPDYQGELKPGSRGPMVVWLKRHLALAQGRTPTADPDPEYDQTLVREVKRFQLAAGLVPDGIVGPMTIMPLSPATDPGDPVLQDGKGAL